MTVTGLPTEGLVPSWVLGAVHVSGCLVNRVSNTYPAVGVHACPAIVLNQLSLHEQGDSMYMYMYMHVDE